MSNDHVVEVDHLPRKNEEEEVLFHRDLFFSLSLSLFFSPLSFFFPSSKLELCFFLLVLMLCSTICPMISLTLQHTLLLLLSTWMTTLLLRLTTPSTAVATGHQKTKVYCRPTDFFFFFFFFLLSIFCFIRGQYKNGICGCDCCQCSCCISFWFSDCQNVKLISLMDNDRPPTMWKVSGRSAAIGLIYLVLIAMDMLFSFVSAFRLYYLYAIPASCLVGLVVMRVITRIRAAREIGVHETCCQSCCNAFWCAPCSSVQITDSFVAAGEPEARLFH